jgi:polyisoprenoid-binding protein YceI
MAITTTEAPFQTFTIDKAHSEASFSVRHLITKVRGRFTDFEGSVQFDEEHPDRSSVAFLVEAASVDTGEPDRDAHLRSADFFDVSRFPTLAFTSTRVTAAGPNRFDVEGQLTIRGVSRSIGLPVVYLGTAKDPWGNERAGFETEVTISRSDFGLTWNAALETGGFLVGDEVTIALSIQAIARS